MIKISKNQIYIKWNKLSLGKILIPIVIIYSWSQIYSTFWLSASEGFYCWVIPQSRFYFLCLDLEELFPPPCPRLQA